MFHIFNEGMVLGTHLPPCNPVETVSPPDSKLPLHYKEPFIKVSSETVERVPLRIFFVTNSKEKHLNYRLDSSEASI